MNDTTVNRRDFLRRSLLAGGGMVAGAGWSRAAAAAAGDGSHDFPALMKPAPETAKFMDPDFYVWCGTMTRDDGGVYHLFYSRWPRALGHNAWVTHSEVAHATGEASTGAFKHKDIALPARGREFRIPLR